MARLTELFLLLLVIFNPVVTDSLSEEIEVLVFLPQNNSYLFSHARVAPAIRYAQDRLKAEYPGFHFNIHFENSEPANRALFALADRSCGQKPDLIIGPVREYEAAGVVRLASHWKIPVISAGALATAFKNKGTEYSHLTRIAPSYVKMAETFTAMFEHFTWKSALLLIEDDMKERDCYFTMEGVYHLMDDYNVEFEIIHQEAPFKIEDIFKTNQDIEGKPALNLYTLNCKCIC
uniref:Receptor ligand binding region domain-containing protein n=1 Tax=Fundulus heteroclitus TaxID=8078 RepID=A0A3Q2QK56_FUNHE